MDNLEYLISTGWKIERKSGNEMLGKCPHHAHTDNSPSFYINSDTGAFNCFSCGFKGKSLATLISGVENITLREAIMKIGYEKRERTLFDKMQDYFQTYKEKQVSEYMKTRGLNEETAKKYGIGYCDSSVIKWLKNKGIKLDEIQSKKIIVKNSFIPHERISIPIYRYGAVVGFSFRATKHDQEPKYITILDSGVPKVFNISSASASDVVITEGVFDAIAVENANYKAVALLGGTITDAIMQHLKEKTLYLMFDNDKAGKEFILKFLKYTQTHHIRVCTLPKKDPAECNTQEIMYSYASSKHIIEYMIDLCFHEDCFVYIDNLKKLSQQLITTKEFAFAHIIESIVSEIAEKEIVQKKKYLAMFKKQFEDNITGEKK